MSMRHSPWRIGLSIWVILFLGFEGAAWALPTETGSSYYNARYSSTRFDDVTDPTGGDWIEVGEDNHIQIFTGRRYQVSVFMQNNGTRLWPSSPYQCLLRRQESVNVPDEILVRPNSPQFFQEIGFDHPPYSVNVGSTYDFRFNFQAPETPGVYRLRAMRLIYGYLYPWTNYWPNTWFGEATPEITVEVVPAGTGQPPVISNVRVVEVDTDHATIDWETNRPTNSLVEYGATPDYGMSSTFYPALVTAHRVTIGLPNIPPDTLWHFRVISSDLANQRAVSEDFTFSYAAPPPPPPPPVISEVAASDVVNGLSTITWKTDAPSNSRVEYGPTASYGNAIMDPAHFVTDHSIRVWAVEGGWHFRVISSGVDGGQAVSDDYVLAGGPPDTTPPVLSVIEIASTSATTAEIRWQTDESSDSTVEYGTTIAYGRSVHDSLLGTRHYPPPLTSLWPNTLYHFRVSSADAAGNISFSPDMTFYTASLPPQISEISSETLSSSVVEVRWMTDVPADSQVEYGTTPAHGSVTPIDGAMTTSHTMRIAGLEANALYHFCVKSRSERGPVATSEDATFTTLAAPVVYHVNWTGDDNNPGTQMRPWKTLQRAADAVKPGDTVIVYQGMYEGFDLSTSGTPMSPIVFKSVKGNYPAVLSVPNSDRERKKNVRLNGASFVTLEGFTVKTGLIDYQMYEFGSIESTANQGVMIKSFTFIDNREGIRATDSRNIQLLLNKNVKINLTRCHGARVQSNHYTRIQLVNSDHSVIRKNISEKIAVYADDVDFSDLIEDVLIEKNLLAASAGTVQISVGGGDQVTIQNNLMTAPQLFPFIEIGVGYRDTQVSGRIGIYHNTMIAQIAPEVPPGPHANWLIEVAANRDYVNVSNNILINKNPAGFIYALTPGALGYFIQGGNNIFGGHDNIAGTIAWQGSILYSLSHWQAEGHDAASVISRPEALFINPTNDFHIKRTSPAFNAARVLVPAVTNDFDDHLRPALGASDVGFDEYVPEEILPPR